LGVTNEAYAREGCCGRRVGEQGGEREPGGGEKLKGKEAVVARRNSIVERESKET